MSDEDIVVQESVEQGTHNYSDGSSWVPPTDPALLRQLEWFQDQKLALMMHWGPYSQIGIVESWALSDADGDWSRGGVDWDVDIRTFKQQYFDLARTFNPIRFSPSRWADLAADNGFRYLIFTTKHHDGFCMWDTRYSAYKITAPDCPFHANPNADVVRKLFDAFRRRGLGISAYFSKADWHVPTYWNPEYERGSFTHRGPSYRPEDHPEIWEQFVEFTHNQVLELCRDYGKIDILWFDAGWVCAGNGQDIRLGELVDTARRIQPWILSADRTVGGPYENYVTPEQCVPEVPLDIPWESCITLGTSFSFKYEDRYKSPRELVHLLIDVVAKGGNLALNVGPQPDGRLPEGAIRSMEGLGEWLRSYGEAIYGTRTLAPFKRGGTAFTRNGSSAYALHCFPDDAASRAREVLIPYDGPVSGVTEVSTGETLDFRRTAGGCLVTQSRRRPGCASIAQCFALETGR